MPFVRTKPSEFLVTADHGRLVSRGAAVRLFLRPGTPHVKVPGDQRETCFEMTQETRDGIPLRFKGNVVFRIVAPALTAQLFDFTSFAGLEAMQALISKACLGELRDRVSHMTMKECIEERKTTLTGAVRDALSVLVGDAERGWGVVLDVVQVAQVFIVDQDLRRQLEAETRNQIRSASQLAEMQAGESVQVAKIASARRVQQQTLEAEKQRIALDSEKNTLEVQAAESVDLAKIASARRVQQQTLETDKQRIALDSEKDALEKQAERARIETDTPVQLLRVRDHLALLRAKKEELELQREVRALEVETDLIAKRAELELSRQRLPIEQRPQIVESVSRMFQGARLSVYGEDCKLMETVHPLLDLVAGALQPPKAEPEASER